jgi:hypothetical protein
VSDHDTQTSSHGGPRPGDPRSDGPRPPAGWRDLVWVSLTVGLAALTVWQLGRLAIVAATDPGVAPTGVGLVLAFAITVVWLLTVYWLVMGAWRRSVWGCPFAHDPTAATNRRCHRHGTVPVDGPDAAPEDGDADGVPTGPTRQP